MHGLQSLYLCCQDRGDLRRRLRFETRRSEQPRFMLATLRGLRVPVGVSGVYTHWLSVTAVR